MKGYKALDMDMRAVHGNGMWYEMGKLYSIEENVVPCRKGFHFCKSIEELNGCYKISSSRIFEIEAYGEVVERGCKCAAEKIKLVRELTMEEINDYFKQNQKKFVESAVWYIRQAVAEQGYGLDKLMQDGNCAVRATVAKQGYGLNILIGDQDWYIRKEVAKQGYGLDVLIKDSSWLVRSEVAKQGYGLDILINDKEWQVRQAVAEQGYGLDILINDEDNDVRRAVAEQGYGLDILVHDKDCDVKFVAQEMLKRKKI